MGKPSIYSMKNQIKTPCRHFASEQDAVSKIADLIKEKAGVRPEPIKVSGIKKEFISFILGAIGVYVFLAKSNQGVVAIYVGGSGSYAGGHGTLGGRLNPDPDGRSFGHEKYRLAIEMGYENLTLYVYPMQEKFHTQLYGYLGPELRCSISIVESYLIRMLCPKLNECHNNLKLKAARADDRRERFLSRVRSRTDGCSFSYASQGIGWNHADQICKNLILEGLITECRMRNCNNVMCRMLFPVGSGKLFS